MFQESTGELDFDSSGETPEHVRDRMLEGFLGWRYDHPDRYSHDDAWAKILKTGSVVRVVIGNESIIRCEQ